MRFIDLNYSGGIWTRDSIPTDPWVRRWRNGNKANTTAEIRALACNWINFRALCSAAHGFFFGGAGAYQRYIVWRLEVGIFQFLTLTRAHSNFSLVFAPIWSHRAGQKLWPSHAYFRPVRGYDLITGSTKTHSGTQSREPIPENWAAFPFRWFPAVRNISGILQCN